MTQGRFYLYVTYVPGQEPTCNMNVMAEYSKNAK